MRQFVVAGNWKMNGSLEANAHLLEQLKSQLDNTTKAEIIVFPPTVYLAQIQQICRDTGIKWGAQDASPNRPGAYTGEIAVEMLEDFACEYVLVGHSERRTLYHEDDVMIAMKFAHAKRHGLTPILCVGETLHERKQQVTETIVKKQLDAIVNLADSTDVFKHAMIAYEPIWAIGTGLTASPEQAQSVHHAIREHVATIDKTIAEQLTLLYGGSVKAANAASLFAMPDIDGFLVGGASLDAHQFVEITQCIK